MSTAALRRVTVDGKAVPVLCGASFRNRGVQPLLDAVVNYLPSPLDRPPALAYGEDGAAVAFTPLPVDSRSAPARGRRGAGSAATEPVPDDRPCALAFKVTHDRQRGPLVYFRVYSGTVAAAEQRWIRTVLTSIPAAFWTSRSVPGAFDAKAFMFNATRATRERPTRLLTVYAKQTEEVDVVTAGNIGVAVGLKQTASGDTLLGATHAGGVGPFAAAAAHGNDVLSLRPSPPPQDRRTSAGCCWTAL